MGRNILVHIGKCGGSTCREAIIESTVRIDHIVHIKKPPFDPEARYFIIARSPMARALSAFNWRHHLVNQDPQQRSRFPGEYEIIMHYKTLNTLAEALFFENNTPNALVQGNLRSIHHLGESIAYYLDPLLKKISAEQIGGVVMQETLADDLFNIFGVTATQRAKSHQHKTPGNMMQLSDRAQTNLRRVLLRDYECLDVLRGWGKMNPAAYPHLDAERRGIAP
jgi:hypothetical protein